MMRIFFVLLVGLSALIGPDWLFFVTAGLFSVKYCGYEVILIAALVDAYFGLGSIPYYVLITTAGVMMIEWLKPKVTLYTV
jgi:hypothetical protein